MSPHSAAILITLGLALLVGLCVVIPMYGLMALFKLNTQPTGGTATDVLGVLLLLSVFGWTMSLLNEFAVRNHLREPGITTWLLAGVVVLVVHEMGHLAIAKVVGFRINLFSIGPLVMQRTDARWKLRFDLTIMRHGSAGMVGSTPMSSDNLRSNLLLMIAGGPAASLLFALVALLMLLRAPGSDVERFGYGFGVYGVLSFLVFVQALWPVRGFFLSDGLVIFTLMCGGADADRLCASARLGDGALRPRDWDEAFVTSLIADGQRTPALVSGYTFAYAHALDAGKIEDAGAYIDQAANYANGMPAKELGPVFFESAYFEARHRNNAARGREYLDRAAGLPRADTYAIPRCRAAVLIAEGRYAEAGRALEEAKSDLSRTGQTGDTMAEWDLVHDLERQLENHRGIK